jgi:hypothetical protein
VLVVLVVVHRAVVVVAAQEIPEAHKVLVVLAATGS